MTQAAKQPFLEFLLEMQGTWKFFELLQWHFRGFRFNTYTYKYNKHMIPSLIIWLNMLTLLRLTFKTLQLKFYHCHCTSGQSYPPILGPPVTSNSWHSDVTMGCCANLWTLISLPIFMRLYMTFHFPLQPPPTSTSIHHFCMEPLFPQLSATLQTISWRTHTSREDRSPKKVHVNIILTAATTLGLHIVSKLKESLSPSSCVGWTS